MGASMQEAAHQATSIQPSCGNVGTLSSGTRQRGRAANRRQSCDHGRHMLLARSCLQPETAHAETETDVGHRAGRGIAEAKLRRFPAGEGSMSIHYRSTRLKLTGAEIGIHLCVAHSRIAAEPMRRARTPLEVDAAELCLSGTLEIRRRWRRRCETP